MEKRTGENERELLRLADAALKLAELHWYGGQGKGRKETKIKKYLE